jgi:hypothetical protein
MEKVLSLSGLRRGATTGEIRPTTWQRSWAHTHLKPWRQLLRGLRCVAFIRVFEALMVAGLCLKVDRLGRVTFSGA